MDFTNAEYWIIWIGEPAFSSQVQTLLGGFVYVIIPSLWSRGGVKAGGRASGLVTTMGQGGSSHG